MGVGNLYKNYDKKSYNALIGIDQAKTARWNYHRALFKSYSWIMKDERWEMNVLQAGLQHLCYVNCVSVRYARTLL
jgi:hypothetical protein